MGSALAAPKFGTASGVLLGDALGDPLGDPDACGDGVVWTWPVGPPLFRLASTMTPKIPSRTTSTTATAAGISQGGRPASSPAPRDGVRGTVRLRCGAVKGAR